MNAREAHEIWTAYRDRGLGHFVPFWTRGVPVFRRVRQLLAEGLIGEIRGVVYSLAQPAAAIDALHLA